MREIEVWYHDDSYYLTPKHVLEKDISKYIEAWKNDELFEYAKELNADHFIYMTNTYNQYGELIMVDFYSIGLDDAEFRKRVDENNAEASKHGNGVYYGVWHKGTNYGGIG